MNINDLVTVGQNAVRAINNLSQVVTAIQAALSALSLGVGALATVRVVTVGGPVTVTTDDYMVVINKTVGAATAVSLPVSTVGRTFIIKDGKGDAPANNITITPPLGTTIDSAGTLVLTIAFESVTLTFDGTDWRVV